MNTTTVSAKVQEPVTSRPTNESLSLIEWAQHTQAIWRKVAESISNQAWLAQHGFGDVSSDELFASA